MEELIKFHKRPRLKNPDMIVAWPGMGEVAFKAATYLVEKLKAEEFAEISASAFFYQTGSLIQNGILGLPPLPYSKFYFWKNSGTKADRRDLLIFISNAQPDLSQAAHYTRQIIEIAQSFKVRTVFSFASLPLPIDHTVNPEIWFSATDKSLFDQAKRYNLKVMNEGQISGMNGLFLGMAKEAGMKGICLLGEIPLYTIQIENPRAAHAILAILCKMLNINIDLSGLEEQAHFVEGEINKLIDYIKSGSEQPQPIGDEEIDRIKKSLSLHTKLPQSIKIKIDKLFEEAKKDISKANELKRELDHWNVYKEYEDKFLDLFKKTKDKGN